jgi:hypothetical protein
MYVSAFFFALTKQSVFAVTMYIFKLNWTFPERVLVNNSKLNVFFDLLLYLIFFKINVKYLILFALF